MAITIYRDRIEFGNYTLTVTDNGIQLDGNINASDFLVIIPPTPMGGTVSGYTSGGQFTNVIEKYPFATDANATDVGDLTLTRFGPAGQSSDTHGYTTAGKTPGLSNTIDKFSFSVDTNATNIGSLATGGNYALAGQSSNTHGYKSSGFNDPGNFPPSYRPEIEKFPFATDTNASNVGNVTQERFGISGASSLEHGYSMAGNLTSNVIDRFPFATDTNATDVGDLTNQRYWQSGISSSTAGYTSGGKEPPGLTNVSKIDKFNFASASNATNIGNITTIRGRPAGQNSITFGYTTSGEPNQNVIDKFPFATDTNATDVGDLTQSREGPTGQQD